jgi:hypothetical protein
VTPTPTPTPAPAANSLGLPTAQCLALLEIGRLAANGGMHPLSLRAVRQALQTGPPTSQPQRNYVVAGGGPVLSTVLTKEDPEVARVLAEIVQHWERSQVPAGEVYDVLADVVLPRARPQELFMYALPDPARRRPTSHLSESLIDWAVRADRTDDLRRRLVERRANIRIRTNVEALLQSLDKRRVD